MIDFKSKRLFSDESAAGWVPFSWLTPVVGFAMILVSMLIGHNLNKLAGFAGKGAAYAAEWELLAYLVSPFAFMAMAVYLWTRFVERRSLASIGLVPGRGGYGPGFLAGLVMVIAVVAAITLAGGYEIMAWAPAFGQPMKLAKIGLYLAGFILQAGVEEILFRGWLLSAATRRAGLWAGMAATTLLFTLMHLGENTTFLDIADSILFSLFACLWAVRSGSIWAVMGWHAAWNWLMGVGFEIPITGEDAGVPALLVGLKDRGPVWLTGGGLGPEGSLFCQVLFVALIAAMVLRPKAPHS